MNENIFCTSCATSYNRSLVACPQCQEPNLLPQIKTIYCYACGTAYTQSTPTCNHCGAENLKYTSPNTSTNPNGTNQTQRNSYSNHSTMENVNASANPASPKTNQPDGDKSVWLTTFLLCFFLGGFGAHRFYVGKSGSAFGMIGLFIVAFICMIGGSFSANPNTITFGFILLLVYGLWCLGDLISILTGTFTNSDEQLITTKGLLTVTKYSNSSTPNDNTPPRKFFGE